MCLTLLFQSIILPIPTTGTSVRPLCGMVETLYKHQPLVVPSLSNLYKAKSVSQSEYKTCPEKVSLLKVMGNIREGMKFYNKGDQSFETDFS